MLTVKRYAILAVCGSALILSLGCGGGYQETDEIPPMPTEGPSMESGNLDGSTAKPSSEGL
jgi:hypothetical protein